MKLVHLTNNVIGAEPMEILLSEKDFKKVQALQYCGGFLRFGIDIYSETKGGKTDRRSLISFLRSVFQNSALIESMF